MKKTCCSLNCPLINYCKDYNFLVDRGDECETQKNIIKAVEKIKKQKKEPKLRMTL